MEIQSEEPGGQPRSLFFIAPNGSLDEPCLWLLEILLRSRVMEITFNVFPFSFYPLESENLRNLPFCRVFGDQPSELSICS